MTVTYRKLAKHAILHCRLSSRFDYLSLNHFLKYPGFRSRRSSNFSARHILLLSSTTLLTVPGDQQGSILWAGIQSGWVVELTAYIHRIPRFGMILDLSPDFTFMLPCIVIDLFLNNQHDALIIQTYSVIKLYIFRASSLPIIRSFLPYIRYW